MLTSLRRERYLDMGITMDSSDSLIDAFLWRHVWDLVVNDFAIPDYRNSGYHAVFNLILEFRR